MLWNKIYSSLGRGKLRISYCRLKKKKIVLEKTCLLSNFFLFIDNHCMTLQYVVLYSTVTQRFY